MASNPVTLDAPGDRSTTRRSLPRALLVEARPKQWVKNLLVFAAPGAAGVIGEARPFVQTLGAFGCFCLAATGTYYLNDAADLEADRLHPTKRFRPVAAGEIPLTLARVIGASAIVGAVLAAFAVNWHLAVVVACYVGLTTSYSLWLKHIAVADVIGVAAGFVLRAVAGGAAVDVPISNWFFIVASFGSLFMVAGKRYSEIHTLGAQAGTRRSLGYYSESYLRFVWVLAASITITSYSLWAFGQGEGANGVPWAEISLAPFVLGLLRYAVDIDRGTAGTPEDIVFRDRALQGIGVVWAVTAGLSVFAG